MQRAFGQKRARSLVSAAKSGRRCRRGRRPRWFRLVEIPKMRRSTTAALNERGYIFVGAPGCRKQFRGAVRRRLCTRVPAISRQINFWNGEELMRRDTVTAVQQGAALQQQEKFHG